MNEFESRYVNNVYNSISNEFSHTRQFPWPIVKSFVNSLEPNSLVCDVGSGNGKNIYRTDIVHIATDLSVEMCTLSSKKADTLQSNVLSLPFKNNTFDAVISIACVHHLSSHERRKKAVTECKRILKPNGKLLISLWSESEKYGTGDQFIKWNKHNEKRYYHLFNEQEVKEICSFNCEVLYERYNYYIKI
jgi:ubiquinone/menaquinone biosynthesis C-methylase UbiE